ncbi:MAG: M24 family metallopeptidase [Planctomycetaceae bacterium]
MFDLPAVQAALKQFGFDAWLLYDFRGSNVLAVRILDISADAIGSRRFAYCVPAEGEPRKLVHRIESGALDHLPGSKTVYLKWQEWESGVASLLDGCKNVAMEYSPRHANPYVAKVDAGLIELVRESGVDVGSSGDLVQLFEAAWTDEQWEMHLEAATHTDSAFARAWRFIAGKVRSDGETDELAVQREILDHFAEHGMTTYHPPIVGVGPHSGNPHYETGAGDETAIREGDFVLIDLWAKLDRPGGVYSDLTRTGFVGSEVPGKYTEIFDIVTAGRDAAIETVRKAFADGEPLRGWQVDRACRNVIETAGYGEFFVHRTGHSIGRETHGNGANMDDLETHEERRILPRTCFSIEPGIYLPEFGVRSEVNVYVDQHNAVHVTGGELQTEVLPILAAY